MTNPSPADHPSADALLGRRVHQLMWDRKITQTDFGPKVGIEQSNLAKKLRGVRGWSLDEVQRVAVALETTVSYLAGETEDPRRPKPGGGPGRPEHDSNVQPTGLLNNSGVSTESLPRVDLLFAA